MFLAIVILKSFIELSLMFVVGRFILGLLAGAKRQTYVLTTDPLINRKPGSSKILIKQRVTSKNGKRVIFRVIERKL
jgi:hypothetical protein